MEYLNGILFHKSVPANKQYTNKSSHINKMFKMISPILYYYVTVI